MYPSHLAWKDQNLYRATKKKRFWLAISAKPSFESSSFRYQMCEWRNTQMISPSNHSNHPSHSSLPRWGPAHYRAEISPTLCVLFKFLIYRDFKHNKWLFYITRFGGGLYAAIDTGIERRILKGMLHNKNLKYLVLA